LQGVSTRIASGALALVAVVALSACGDDNEKNKGGSTSTENTLSLSIGEAGNKARFTAPKSAKGGLTTVKLTNDGKRPHSAQLLLIKGNHTPEEVGKALSPDSKGKNEWLRARGGVGVVPPGKTASAAVVLEAGRYLVADLTQEGPPTFAQLKLTAGAGGSLPATDTSVTAAEAGKDKYRWDISGPLRAGDQNVTFKSEGKEALHFIQAARIVGKASKQDVITALSKEGKPPKFVDEQSFYSTAILDGGKQQITPLVLSKPGRWLFFCALSDRGEKKPHFKEGMVKFVTVK
jgi:hypothetical protein